MENNRRYIKSTLIKDNRNNYFFLTLVFFLIFGAISIGNAQKSFEIKIDSLNNLLSSTKVDSLKIPLLLELSQKYQNIDLNKAKEYSAKAFKIIKINKVNHYNGDYYNVKSKEYLSSGEFENSILMCKNAQLIYLKQKNIISYLKSVNIESLVYINQFNIKKAKEVVENNINKYKNSPYQSEIANLYISKGIAEGAQNKLLNAIVSIERALFIFNKTKDVNGIYKSNSIIAQFYISTQSYDKALKFINLCKNDNSISKSELDLVSENLTLAMLYYYKENYNKASIEIENCFKIAKKIGYVSLQEKISRFYVKIYIALNDIDKLYNYCYNQKLVLDKSDQFDFPVYFGFSYVYYAKKQFNKAKQYNSIILENLDNENNHDTGIINYINDDLNLYDHFANTEFQLKNYKQAYYYKEKFSKLKFDFLKEQNLSKVIEYQDAFESKQKDLELKDLELLKQNQRLEILKQKNYNSTLFIAIISIFVALTIVLLALFNSKKVNIQLQEKNKIISEKIDQVEEQKLKLSESLFERELLLKEIHHRVKNNLQIVMSLLNIQAKEGLNNNIEDFVEKAQSRVSSMLLIHQSLYENEKLSSINFQDYLTNLTNNLISLFGLTNKKIKINIHAKDIYIDIQTAIPLGLIINELISNSFKHAFTNFDNAIISISIVKETDISFELTYSDNGKGFTIKDLEKKTLGHELIKLLARQMKTSIEKQDSLETTFKMNFKELS